MTFGDWSLLQENGLGLKVRVRVLPHGVATGSSITKYIVILSTAGMTLLIASRIILSCLVASKTLRNKQGIYRIYGCTTVTALLGTTLYFLLPLKSRMRDHRSHFILTGLGLSYTEAIRE